MQTRGAGSRMLLPLAGHLMPVIQRLLSHGLCCHLAGFTLSQSSAESYRQSAGLLHCLRAAALGAAARHL